MDLLPYEEYVEKLNRKRTPAGVLIRNPDSSRVLLVRTSYAPPGITENWEIPGGAAEAGEAPWTTARRELREELGLDRPLNPPRPLVIDYVPQVDLMPEGVAFIFDGGVITDAEVSELKPTDPEIVSVGLYTLAEATGRVTPVLAGRLTQALYAQVNGITVCCESGKPTSGTTPFPA